MKSICRPFLLVIAFSFSACSGGSGGGISTLFNANNSSETPTSSSPSSPEIPVSQIETAKLQESLINEQAYKIADSELELLKQEGFVTDEDIIQLKTIQ